MTRSGRSVLLWPGQSMAGHKQSVHPRGTAEDRISDTWRPARAWHAKRCHQKPCQRIRWSCPAPGAAVEGSEWTAAVPAGTEAHNAKFDSSAAGPFREESDKRVRQGRRTTNACPNRQSFQTSRAVQRPRGMDKTWQFKLQRHPERNAQAIVETIAQRRGQSDKRIGTLRCVAEQADTAFWGYWRLMEGKSARRARFGQS